MHLFSVNCVFPVLSKRLSDSCSWFSTMNHLVVKMCYRNTFAPSFNACNVLCAVPRYESHSCSVTWHQSGGFYWNFLSGCRKNLWSCSDANCPCCVWWGYSSPFQWLLLFHCRSRWHLHSVRYVTITFFKSNLISGIIYAKILLQLTLALNIDSHTSQLWMEYLVVSTVKQMSPHYMNNLKWKTWNPAGQFIYSSPVHCFRHEANRKMTI